MSSTDGRDDDPTFATRFQGDGRFGNLETMLFEGLVYQLIEKGLLTKNDALSIVQTVAEVQSGQRDDAIAVSNVDAELTLLQRLYDSFEALQESSGNVSGRGDNVHHLRPPLHQDAPKFPLQD